MAPGKLGIRRTVLCAVLLLCASAWARGGWDDPPGGWDYLYEANAGQAAYVELTDVNPVPGLLDGDWLGGSDSYFWDGSASGTYDVGNAAGNAPGGAEIKSYAFQGEGGTTASVLSLEVVGDTTDAGANPFSFAWDTPANEAIYFFQGVYQPGATSTWSVKDGTTLIARWRLKPSPVDVETPGGQKAVMEQDYETAARLAAEAQKMASSQNHQKRQVKRA